MSFLQRRKSKSNTNTPPLPATTSTAAAATTTTTSTTQDNACNNTNKHNTVLVTVGTTRFDALIKAIDSKELADVLAYRGYSKIVVQAGKSDHAPTNIINYGEAALLGGDGGGDAIAEISFKDSKHGPLHSCVLDNGLAVEWYEYLPSLAPLLQTCKLVISHAGSGSLFEALNCASATVIAVPNNALMDNHQIELAEKLAGEGYLFAATPETLLSVVKNMNEDSLLRYSPGDGRGIVEGIDAVCGVHQAR